MPAARTTRLAGLTPELVAAAALDLLDRDGLEAFSMRALARELDVQVGALYVHVSDREALLAAVAELILHEVEVPASGLRWRDWLTTFAHSYREVLHRHAGASPLVSGQLVSNGREGFPRIELILAVLDGSGFSGAALAPAYNSFLGWLIGFVGVELAPGPSSASDWVARRQLDLDDLDPAEFPTITRHSKELAGSFALRWRNGVEAPMDDAFAAALEVVLAGLQEVHRPGRRTR